MLKKIWGIFFTGTVSFVIGIFSTYAYNTYYSPSLSYYKETIDFSVPYSKENDVYNDIEIIYKGKKYKNFYITKLVLTNDGGEHLGSTSPQNPMKINIKNVDYFSLDTNNSNPTANVYRKGDILNLDFEYLNIGESIVINFMHNGNATLEVQGALYRINHIKYKEKYNITAKDIVLKGGFWFLFAFGGIVFLLILIAIIIAQSSNLYAYYLARKYEKKIKRKDIIKKFIYYKKSKELMVTFSKFNAMLKNVPENIAEELLVSNNPYKYFEKNKLKEKYGKNSSMIAFLDEIEDADFIRRIKD